MHLIQPSCILQPPSPKKKKKKQQLQNKPDHPKTPKTNQPQKYRKATLYFCRQLNYCLFIKQKSCISYLTAATDSLDNKLCRFTFGDCFFHFFSATIVSFRESWLKWQCFEDRMWLCPFPTLFEQPGKFFVSPKALQGWFRAPCAAGCEGGELWSTASCSVLNIPKGGLAGQGGLFLSLEGESVSCLGFLSSN